MCQRRVVNSQLHQILFARSIAVIGASNNPGKRGHQAIKQLISDDFDGLIYPINQKEAEVMGLKAYRSVLEVEGPIDVALVCTPAGALPVILAQCGEKGVAGVVVLAAGFGEAGGAGETLAGQSLSIAREKNVRILGPNTNGVFNLYNRMNLVGVKEVEIGHIGVVSQSGNMALAIFADAQRRGDVGFSAYIGVGNQLDVNFSDYLRYLGEDEYTDAAVLYVEGLKDGRRFLDDCRDVTQNKPVVVYKSGRTKAGIKSVGTHTGSLAGNFMLTRDLLHQAGATVIERSDMILPIADGLARLPVRRAGKVAILSDGGGHASVAADAVIEHGLCLAEFSAATSEKLASLLPLTATVNNPLDTAGATENHPERFVDFARILLEEPEVESLLITGMIGGYAARFTESLLDLEIETSIDIGALAHHHCKPIIVQSAYAALRPKPLETLQYSRVPVFEWTEPAVRCIAELDRYAKARERIANTQLTTPEPPEDTAKVIVSRAVETGRISFFEYEAKNLLKAHYVAIPPHVIIREPGDLVHAIEQFAEVPVAMKIVSSDILHKSDAGGVKLNVSGLAAMTAAYEELLVNAKGYKADAVIDSVLVSPMAPPGIECIIGTFRDPIFGPVVMFGLGGIFVDVLKNVAFRALPICLDDANDMIDQIRSSELLDGLRGTPPPNRALLADLIMRIAGLALTHPEIAEVDLNPVIAREDSYDIVDARMILRTL